MAACLALSARVKRSKFKYGSYVPSFTSQCRSRVAPYKNWNDIGMEKAVAEVEKGTSIRRASDMFDVPRSTLHDRVTGRIAMGARSGKKPYLTRSEEEELVSFLLKCAAIGYPHSRHQVIALVQQIVECKGMDNIVTEGWWQRFSQRHQQLALRTAIPLSYARAMATDSDVIGRYYDLLEDTLRANDIFNMPTQIYNCDETGLPLSPKPLKVVDVVGAKHPSYVTGDTKAQITVMACTSAAGTSIPPFVIFDRKSLNPQMTIGEVPGTLYGLSQKGWIDRELFRCWFFHHFLMYIPPVRPVLLLLDGHSSHYCPDVIKLAAAEKVIIFILPPHTTHLTQPLDRSVFGSLKVSWRKVCHSFVAKNAGRVVTRYDFSQLFAQAWYQSMTMSNIISGFKVTGVCPFKRVEIPGEKNASFDPENLPKSSGLAYIPLYSPARGYPVQRGSTPSGSFYQHRHNSSFEVSTLEVSRELSASDSYLFDRSASSDLGENCVMAPLQKSSSLSKLFKVPEVPSKLPTKHVKSSGRILTSVENMKVMDEREKEKQEKEKLKQERKKAREEKAKQKKDEKEARERTRLEKKDVNQRTKKGSSTRSSTAIKTRTPLQSRDSACSKIPSAKQDARPDKSTDLKGPVTRQQIRKQKEIGTPDVKTVSDSDPDPEYDWWIQDLNLEQSDLHILSCDQELNDKLINAAQTLLSRQYPTVSGFQSTLLGTKLGFKPIDSDAALGVQIFHTGSDHWICTSRHCGSPVQVMDSLMMPMNLHSVLQIATVYSVPKDKMELHVRRLSVQQQVGAVDCGLFAVAFSVELCIGTNLEAVHLDCLKMRKHLQRCLFNGIMKPFPKANRSHSDSLPRPKSMLRKFKVYCDCRLPAEYDSSMVSCDACGLWFHCSCVNVNCKRPPRVWKCSVCSLHK